MPNITLIVHHEVGLHARPASLFVQTAKQFECDIQLACDEREVNAKSILGVLTLGAGQGARITVRAKGEDADQALEALKTLVESDFEVQE